MEDNPGYICFDPVADEYDKSRYLPPETQVQAAALLSDLAQLQPGQALLDAGVGTGRFALPLAQAGVPVVGIDISESMMTRLQSKRTEAERAGTPLPLRLARGDLRHLPLASHSCGAALMVHILHLIVDWQAVLGEIHRVLTPGGRLMLAQGGGGSEPTRLHYFTLARQRGLLREHIGAQNAGEVRAYLAQQGARLERGDEERVRWKLRWTVGEVLEMLRRRTWSTLWTVPDAEHAELMAATEAWALANYGSLEVMEETDAMLTVWVARWA